MNSSSAFLPHGQCLLWEPALLWLHIVSDSIITVAYYSIPILLSYFMYKRTDLAFRWMFLLFSVFIFACGTTHLMEIWTLWHPSYWTEGVIKAVTAGTSLATAILLVPLVPKALALPSPAELNEANQRLRVQIEERERVEAALRASEARFRAIFEHAGAGLVCATHRGGFIDANPTFCHFLRFSAEELRMLSVADVTHPEDQAVTQARFDELMAGRCDVIDLEKRYLRKDGVVVWGHTTAVRLCHDDHSVFCLAVIVDITARKQAEAALEEIKERFRIAAESASDFVYEWNLKSNTVEWFGPIDARLGYAPGLFPRTLEAWEHLLHPDDHERVMAAVERHLKQPNGLFSADYRITHPDGSILYWTDRGMVLRDPSGAPCKWIGVVTDVTDRRRAEDALRERERELRAALDEREALSHDLHDNIIQSMYALGMSLEECQYLIKEDPAVVGRKLGQALTDLNTMIRDVRGYIDGGTRMVVPSRLRAELARLLRTMRASKVMEFRLELEPTAARTLTAREATELFYIVKEATSNSVRHSGGAHGTVSIQRTAGGLCLQVKDDGRGFDIERAERAGTGLASMRARVERLGGRLHIHSTQGGGTEVVVAIPTPTRRLALKEDR
ncbi:PAS domain S-box protein [Candidatus Nitrospira bockiana]